MSVHYKLIDDDPNTPDKEMPKLEIVSLEERNNYDGIIVESISPVEFKELNIYKENENYSPVTIIQSESNFVDDYPDCIVGSFSIPSKNLSKTEPVNLAFYLDKKYLIFVDEGDFSEKLLKNVADSGMIHDMSPAHCLFLAFKLLLFDDLEYLANLEDKMENIEERMLVKHKDVKTKTIMEYRRLTMRLASYYQQITTMATMLSECEGDLITSHDAQQFSHATSLGDRLASKAETLKEYSMQLHEMHQTLIDLQQNSIMQVLTIVTVLIAPMTLVTGWYGMNLTNLPGLSWHPMWIVLIVLFISVTGLLLWLFRRKKWL